MALTELNATPILHELKVPDSTSYPGEGFKSAPPEVIVINMTEEAQLPPTLDTCEGTDLYMVECISTVPRVKEFYHKFHGAYLYAYQLCEGSLKEVAIAHCNRYIMILRPGDSTTHM